MGLRDSISPQGKVPPGTRRYGGWGVLFLVILAIIIFCLIVIW